MEKYIFPPLGKIPILKLLQIAGADITPLAIQWALSNAKTCI
ncbi:hypothetical protein [Thorsellia anophelis]|nr:hypothetical protein [Thorsellia anophelis]